MNRKSFILYCISPPQKHERHKRKMNKLREKKPMKNNKTEIQKETEHYCIKSLIKAQTLIYFLYFYMSNWKYLSVQQYTRFYMATLSSCFGEETNRMRSREEEEEEDGGNWDEEVKEEEKGKMNYVQKAGRNVSWLTLSRVSCGVRPQRSDWASDLCIAQMNQPSRSNRDQRGLLGWVSSTDRIKRCSITSGRRSS